MKLFCKKVFVYKAINSLFPGISPHAVQRRITNTYAVIRLMVYSHETRLRIPKSPVFAVFYLCDR